MSAPSRTRSWDAGEPLRLAYGYCPREQWPLAQGVRDHLEFRDSGLATATAGTIGAQYVRFVGRARDEHGWHVHDLEWQFFYVLRGRMVHETEEAGRRTLVAGDSGCYPGFLWHWEGRFSSDCEMLALRVPAKTTTSSDRREPPPERRLVDPTFGPLYASADPGDWIAAPHPAEGFERCDLGSARASEDRIGVGLLRATGAGASSAWHSRDASTWTVGLAGSALVEVADRDPVELGVLDALSLGPGPQMAYRLLSWNEDFAALELSIPADDGTLA